MTEPIEWRGYWRNDLTLWVYDMTPEFGVNCVYSEEDWLIKVDELGVRLVRQDAPWNVLEGYPERWLGASRAAVRNPTTRPSLELVGLVSSVPPPDLQAPLEGHPAIGEIDQAWRDMFNERFALFMESMVREHPTVKFWQLWNEPDAGCEPGKPFRGDAEPYILHRGSPAETLNSRYIQGLHYADMLRVVYPRMKAVAAANNHEIWIVTAAFTGEEGFLDPASSTDCRARDLDSWEFVRGMYANQGKAYFDILAINVYGFSAGSRHSILETPNIVTYKLNTVWNDSNRPLWVTEMGHGAANTWDLETNSDLLDPARDLTQDRSLFNALQRQFYVEALDVQRDAGVVQKMFGFALFSDDGADRPNTGIPAAEKNDYGLTLIRTNPPTVAAERPGYIYLKGQYTRLREATAVGSRTGTFRIVAPGRQPVGVPYTQVGNEFYLTLTVSTLTPRVIQFEQIP